MTTVAELPILAKVKKVPAPRKQSASTHPSYFEMTKDAIVTMKERTGSSQYAITKFIEGKQKNLPTNFKKLLLVQLRKLVANGKLTTVKHSYKLAPAAKTNAVAVKPKLAAKAKPAVKSKSVAKPKAKVAGKRKAPEKSKVVKKPAKVLKTLTGSTTSKLKKSVGPKKAVGAKRTPAKVKTVKKTLGKKKAAAK